MHHLHCLHYNSCLHWLFQFETRTKLRMIPALFDFLLIFQRLNWTELWFMTGKKRIKNMKFNMCCIVFTLMSALALIQIIQRILVIMKQQRLRSNFSWLWKQTQLSFSGLNDQLWQMFSSFLIKAVMRRFCVFVSSWSSTKWCVSCPLWATACRSSHCSPAPRSSVCSGTHTHTHRCTDTQIHSYACTHMHPHTCKHTHTHKIAHGLSF